MSCHFTVRALAVIGLGAVLAACASDPGPKQVAGTLVGAGAGGSVGAAAATGGAAGNGTMGTATAAAIGGLIGNRIGNAMDDEDKRRAYAAQIQALEGGPSGAPVAWRNPDSGRYGSVVPGPASDQNGLSCRQYTHTIYIDGKPQTARGTACRNSDGTWQAV
jgi:surface antigen